MKYITYNHPTLGEMKVPIDPPLRETGVKAGMKAGSWVAGANSKLEHQVVLPNWDWREFIFLPEKQYFEIGDTFACTNFAYNNSSKIQLKQSTGVEYDLSEAASAELSGTQPGVGNYMDAPPEHGRKFGRIQQKDHPNGDSVSEFYRSVSLDTQRKSLHFDEQYEWIPESMPSIQHHMKQAPLTILIKAGSTNHDVCAVFADYNGIWYMDSYPHTTQDNFLAITTQMPSAILKIVTKPMNTISFVHKKGTGEYGLLSTSSVGSQYVPASTEADLIARGGNVVPLKADGKVNYELARDIEI